MSQTFNFLTKYSVVRYTGLKLKCRSISRSEICGFYESVGTNDKKHFGQYLQVRELKNIAPSREFKSRSWPFHNLDPFQIGSKMSINDKYLLLNQCSGSRSGFLQILKYLASWIQIRIGMYNWLASTIQIRIQNLSLWILTIKF